MEKLKLYAKKAIPISLVILTLILLVNSYSILKLAKGIDSLSEKSKPVSVELLSLDCDSDKWADLDKELAQLKSHNMLDVDKETSLTFDEAKDIIDAKADSASKPLTTVALSIAEDPRITLSDVFNDKISRNDSETQLLKVLVRNQKNFILQVKSLNFKVIFDEKKELRILLESGDKKEAERLRPQLEMFLQKLKSNTSFRY